MKGADDSRSRGRADKSARRTLVDMSRILAYVLLTGAALLLSWGSWLLATDDRQGGRHLVGVVFVVSALAVASVAIVSLWRSRRR